MVATIQQGDSKGDSVALRHVQFELKKAGIAYQGEHKSKQGRHVYLVEYEKRKYTFKTYEELSSFARMVTVRKRAEFGFLTWPCWNDPAVRGIIEQILLREEQANQLRRLLQLQLRECK